MASYRAPSQPADPEAVTKQMVADPVVQEAFGRYQESHSPLDFSNYLESIKPYLSQVDQNKTGIDPNTGLLRGTSNYGHWWKMGAGMAAGAVAPYALPALGGSEVPSIAGTSYGNGMAASAPSIAGATGVPASEAALSVPALSSMAGGPIEAVNAIPSISGTTFPNLSIPAGSSMSGIQNVANTAAQLPKKSVLGKIGDWLLGGDGHKGLDPTTLLLSGLSLLGGSGTGQVNEAHLNEGLDANKSLVDSITSRPPVKLRSSVVQPGPEPVTIPGIPFQIGGGLGRDPALDNPQLLEGQPPLPNPFNPTKRRTPSNG